jgi:RNA polymerase sigma-70 factor (ECF subfamily)
MYALSSNVLFMDSPKFSVYHKTVDQIKQEEQEILDAIANPKAFKVIYDRYFLDIYKYVFVRLQNEDSTDDVVSKVMVKAMQNLPKYQFKGVPFSAWLYRVAYNELTDVFRKRKADRIVQVPVEDFHHIVMEETEDSMEMERWEAKLKQILPQLKKDQIELIEMRFFESRSFKEIAEILGVTEANAKVKTHRVLAKIRLLLGVK